MSEYHHLVLTNFREREFYRTLEQRQHQHSVSRPSWRCRLAATLRRTADALDGTRRARTRDLATTR